LGQSKPIATEITAQQTYELSIIDIYVDSFPEVGVVFQAKNQKNEPLWLLRKDEIGVRENEKDCEVLRLKNISQHKTFNIGLVLDHSGSMLDKTEGKTALTFAKDGILSFVAEKEVLADPIMLTPFSTTVEKVIPLTNEASVIRAAIPSIRGGGITAFYDALYQTIDTLKQHSNQAAIIGLTDGGDNNSQHTAEEVIKHAQDYDIPIYIIGLGSVNSFRLQQIVSATKGMYYHTNDPNALVDIYQNIKKQLKSIYQLDYRSTGLTADDSTQQLSFYFVNDTMTFSNPEKVFELPEEVIDYLANQAAIRNSTKFRNRLIGGSLLALVFLGVGSFVIGRRRKKKDQSIIIKKHYPNPVQDILTIELDADLTAEGKLVVSNSSGIVLRKDTIAPLQKKIQVNLSGLESGWYFLQINTVNGHSNVVKIRKH